MRLFVSVELPKEVKDHLYDIQKGVKEAKINWVAKKNLHLTLKFIGDVEEANLPKIQEALKKIASKKLKVKLSDIGFFPSKAKPKVIWLGLEPEDQIIKLQQKVDEALITLVISNQEFKSHLTLGRVKSLSKAGAIYKELLNVTLS